MLEPAWLYVVDPDHQRFAVEPKPMRDERPWTERINAMNERYRCKLVGGSVPLSRARSIGKAVAHIRASCPGFEQYEPRAFFAIVRAGGTPPRSRQKLQLFTRF